MNPIPPIGIDLGETSMVAAVYRNGHVEVIPNDMGKTSTPLMVYYDSNTPKVYFGESAKKWMSGKHENEIIDLKKIIGKKYDDSYVQGVITQQQNYFKIIRGCGNSVEIELVHNKKTVIISIEQAYSELIKYLQRCASQYLGVNVTEAVISVPALFNIDQRQATITAANLAGLTVLKLVADPVANAIYYNSINSNIEANILIFNFGKTILNVSVVEAKDNGFRVKTVEEDNSLGGKDFDQIVFTYLTSRDACCIENTMLVDRLRRRTSDLKKSLSTSTLVYVRMESLGLRPILYRNDFDIMTRPLIIKGLDLAKKCVEKSGLSPTDITQVLFVGGTTRIPQVREILCNQLKVIDLGVKINPTETTAFGAAIQASILNEKRVKLEKFVSKDSSQQLNLPQSSIPTEIQQTNILKNDTLLSQGGSHDSLMNSTLTKNSLQNLNLPQPSLPTEIHHTNILKNDTLLSQGGSHDSLMNSTLTKNSLQNLNLPQPSLPTLFKQTNVLENDTKTDEEEEQFEIFTRYKWKVRKICNSILSDLNKIADETERLFVQQKCIQLKDVLGRLDWKQIEVLRTDYRKFKSRVQHIVEDYSVNVRLSDDSDIFNIVLLEAGDLDQVDQ